MTGRIEEGTGSTPSSVDEKVYTLKFVMAGSSGVGKTQLAQRIIRGRFRETSLPTVGIEFGTRALRYADHSSVRAQVCHKQIEIVAMLRVVSLDANVFA